ncbi:hypothetical protein LUZ62_081319 [Rhynchospora pubera]|uniref:Uncharacterized protein n=1 Tax=Rhynchospora pubera TaxID=906938 RepID=A0AAV8BVC1_9POAL|nr:hypothetical protein LUZ62_081319 [Rhynchospora pubera]
MGICCSKKKRAPCDTPSSDPTSNVKHSENEKVKKKDDRKQPALAPKKGSEAPVLEKKSVFVVTQSGKTTEEKEKKKVEVPQKKSEVKKEAETISAGKAFPAEEVRPVQGPVRTSSCTKEEVDAILIQCGRLSRSSSGTTLNEAGGGGAHRRYSGSKRSFDFDHERKGEEYDDERPVSRPSPHRRTPGRERSGSRERGASGGSHSRRVSRSPGRRSDGPASATSANEKNKPAKMVSVPAREKPAESGSVKKSSNGGTVQSKRNASPRSRSPASNSLNRSVGGGNENAGSGAQPSLSRSSSRKAEHSPYRRNPMAEIDENTMKGNQNSSMSFKSQKGNQAQKTESAISSHKGSTDDIKSTKSHTIVTNCIRDQFVTCRVKDQENNTEEQFDPLGSFKSNEINFTNISLESLNTKAVVSTNRSSCRSSRDFDHHGNSYTNLLLEDIQNYHQNHNTNGASQSPINFSIPECVSKACSILEAVADLNSSSSSEARHGFRPKEPFLESEVAVKNDLIEPSMHKYVSVRDLGAEVEPQESAGSNSFVGHPLVSSWEPNSADSTDRYLAGSQSNHMEEIEQEVVGEARQTRHDRRLLRGGSSASGVTGGSNGKKRETIDRQINRNATGGLRPGAKPASVTASASASAC